jgi:hypothetical protein
MRIWAIAMAFVGIPSTLDLKIQACSGAQIRQDNVGPRDYGPFQHHYSPPFYQPSPPINGFYQNCIS